MSFTRWFKFARNSKNHAARRTEQRPRRLSLESLEGRMLLSVTPAIRTIREATGVNAASIQATVDAFRVDLGNPNNGVVVGSQATGRREINWDAVPDGDSAPGRLPGDFFNAISPRGAIFSGSDPRISFQVSADLVNTSATGVEFDNINPTYDTAFGTFSAERLFTSLGNNVYDVEFFVPGTSGRATVSGFGAVFTDVDVNTSTQIEFFDVAGQEIFSRNVLATSGDATLSFLGVSFVGTPVAKVRITAGSAPLGPDDVTQGGTQDMVVVDDFIYGEPQPLPTPQIILGADRNSAAIVRGVNGRDGSELFQFAAYANFTGGVRVATGDVTGDGVVDIVTGPGKGMVGEVRVFSGVDRSLVTSFNAFGGYKSGVHVAVGNLNGDRFMDIIVSRDKGKTSTLPQVRIFDGEDFSELDSFSPYPAAFRGGVTVATGDVNGDYLDDIIAGPAFGIAPIRVFNAVNSQQINEFFAFPGFGGGVFVAAGDVNGDGRADAIVGSNRGSIAVVRTFNPTTGEQLKQYFPFGDTFAGGVRVATADIDGDGQLDILAAPGAGGRAARNIGVNVRALDSFLAFDAFNGGVFVAGIH